VLGGHPGAFHGHPRATKDLDVLVRPSTDHFARSRVLTSARSCSRPALHDNAKRVYSDSKASSGRRRVAAWRAAEVRERQVRRAEALLDATTSLELSEELCELDPDLFREEDPVRKREVGEARAAWAKLRERLACQHANIARA
jgi:hypothetical protein